MGCVRFEKKIEYHNVFQLTLYTDIRRCSSNFENANIFLTRYENGIIINSLIV